MAIHTQGHIHFGLLAEHVPGSLILRHIPAFRKQFPQISFTLSYGTLASIEEQLVADRMTFAVVTDALRSSDFIHSMPCGELDLAAVASASYIQERGPFIRIEQVLLADIVDIGAHMPLVQRWIGNADPSFQTILAHLRPAFTVPNFHAAMELVTAGLGVGYLPRKMMAAKLAAGELVELLPQRPMPSVDLRLVYRKKSARLLADSVFLEYLLEQMPLW